MGGTNRAPFIGSVALLLATLAVSAGASTSAPAQTWEKPTPDGTRVLRMFPEGHAADGTRSGLYPTGTADANPIWVADWYAFADDVVVLGDGTHVVVRGGESALRFFRSGELVQRYGVCELVRYEVDFQHRPWNAWLLTGTLDAEAGVYRITAPRDTRFAFDARTGALLQGALVPEPDRECVWPTPETVARFEAALADGAVERVRALLDAGASPNLGLNRERGTRALHRAAARGDSAMVAVLLDAGADADAPSLDGTPLGLAAKSGDAALVRSLLARGADPNAEQFEGAPPLVLAAEHDSIASVEALLGAGADVRATEQQGRTALHEAKSGAIAERLLAAGAPTDARDARGNTPLAAAVALRRSEVVALLRARTTGSPTPDVLAAAVLAEEWPLAEELLGKGAAVDGAAPGALPALPTAVVEGRYAAARFLLAHGANVNLRGEGGLTALHLAVAFAGPEAVRFVLEAGADPQVRDDHGDTALHSVRNVDSARALLDAGAEVDDRNDRGGTPLHDAVRVAVWSPAAEAVTELLLERGAAIEARDADGATPLLVAAWLGPPEAVALLLRHGAHANTADRFGVTPLHRAAAGFHPASVESLLAHGAKATSEATGDTEGIRTGWTPLHGVSTTEVAERLLAAGARVDAKASDGRTALHVAVEMHHADIVRVLLAHGADPTARDAHGITPRDLAAQDGDPAALLPVLESPRAQR